MMSSIQSLQILCFFLCSGAMAEPAATTYAGRKEMNGYNFSDFRHFEKKWHPVTVRFRKDTNEMRFVYANDKAWRVVKAGGTAYPDGAAFAKLAVATTEDHFFASSAVPSGVRRYQLMIFNKKRHSTTNGWGYALFDANGVTFPENPNSTMVACHSCHSIVANQGYVFSVPMNISSFSAEKVSSSEKLEFEDVLLKDLPAIVRQKLPSGVTKVRMLKGPLRKSLFQGTLDEIRPTLSREVNRSGLPALLLSESGERFSVVFAIRNKKCKDGFGLRGVHNIYFSENQKYEIDFCAQIP
jgi:hypothetical protein